MTQDIQQAAQRKGSLMDTLRAVAWGFFGVRKKSAFQQEAAKINPVHLLIAGLLGAGVFVASILFIVRLIVPAAAS